MHDHSNDFLSYSYIYITTIRIAATPKNFNYMTSSFL